MHLNFPLIHNQEIPSLGFWGGTGLWETPKFPEGQGRYQVTSLDCPEGPLHTLRLGNSPARRFDPRGRKIPPPAPAPPPAPRTEGRKRLILLRQAAWETDCHLARQDQTCGAFPHSLPPATALAKVPGTCHAAGWARPRPFSQHTWASALRWVLLTKVSVSPRAAVLPRNEMKTFQRQLEAFLKRSSRNDVRAAWWRGPRSNR